MDKPRPFLTAVCFLLFVAAAFSTSDLAASTHCRVYINDRPLTLQLLAEQLSELARDAWGAQRNE